LNHLAQKFLFEVLLVNNQVVVAFLFMFILRKLEVPELEAPVKK